MFSLASKRGVDKRAVVRNRARRRLREAMKKVATQVPVPAGGRGVKWVLMATRSTAVCEWADLLEEVHKQWTKILAELAAFQD